MNKFDLHYEYPNRSDEHMLKVKHIVDTHFDENFNYYDKSFGYKIKRFFLFIALHTFVFPLCTLVHGLKIVGKENIKKNKKLFKDGAITIANHVFMWDYICVLKAIRPHLQYHPGWKTNFEGPNRKLIRLVGGIPVPTDNLRALGRFSMAIDNVLEDKHWLHFFPEGSMWFYYPGIRPLKKAIFKYAVKHNRPIIPMAFTFRERKGFWRLFGSKPCVTLNIGKPILPNLGLSQNEAIEEMHVKAYKDMQNLVGLYEGDKDYHTNQNIEHYQKVNFSD